MPLLQTNRRFLVVISNLASNFQASISFVFYKKGTQIAVDAFSYGNIENCNAYFLSHYHYDHFIGLNKHFANKMYCSKITGNLVINQLKVDTKYITILEMNTFSNVYGSEDDSIQVCPLDANQYLIYFLTFVV